MKAKNHQALTGGQIIIFQEDLNCLAIKAAIYVLPSPTTSAKKAPLYSFNICTVALTASF